MDPSLIVGASILLAVALIVFKEWTKDQLSPPGSKGIPFLGCMFGYSADPRGFLQKLHRQYGDVFSMDLAGRHIVLMTGTDAIRKYYRYPETLLSANDAFEDFGFRKKSLKKMPGLNRHILLMKVNPNMDTFITKFCVYMDQYSDSMLESSEAGKVDIFDFCRSTMNRALIASFIDEGVLTTDFMQEMAKYEAAKKNAMMKLILLPKFLSTKSWKAVLEKREDMVHQLLPIIDPMLKDSEANPTIPNYINFLKQYYQEHGLGELSKELLAEYLLDLVFSASSNPAVLSAQTVLMLLTHSEYMEKIVEEVQIFLESDPDAYKHMNVDSINRFKTLDKCVRETLRLITHPIGTLRKALSPLDIESETGRIFRVQAGSFVGIPHNIVTTDDAVYGPSCNDFDPERFSEERQEHRKSPFAYIPFSGGRHACPGKNFALLSAKVVIIQLLAKYSLALELKGKKMPGLTWKNSASLAKRLEPVPISIQKLSG